MRKFYYKNVSEFKQKCVKNIEQGWIFVDFGFFVPAGIFIGSDVPEFIEKWLMSRRLLRELVRSKSKFQEFPVNFILSYRTKKKVEDLK